MRRYPRLPFRLAALILAILALGSAGVTSAQTSPDLLLILDASGSMWGQIEGENKIVIARRVLKDLIGTLPDDSQIGLVAYGHRREGDCEDVETVVAPGPLDRAALGARIDGLNPKGKTPITTAIEAAVEVVRSRPGPTTVVLVSDGIETCGGDPCQAVRAARAAGVELVMHVVGFDVAEVDVSQLECAAQAGGGLYLDADNAADLSAALDRAVAAPADVPAGRLSVQVVADGELVDAAVHVTDAVTGEEAAGGRTYASADTNPRILPLEDGTYNVEVKAVGIRGNVRRLFSGVEIVDGGTVEKVVDFSTGELAIKVTRNGELSDATVRVLYAGTSEQAAASRSYTSPNRNPAVFRLTAGDYDVEVGSVEVAGAPRQHFTAVEVPGGGRAERACEFASGTLWVGAVRGGELVDAAVGVVSVATGEAVDQGRTYASEKSNPRTFEIPPGRYRVTVKGIRLEGDPRREIEVEVKAGAVVEEMVEL